MKITNLYATNFINKKKQFLLEKQRLDMEKNQILQLENLLLLHLILIALKLKLKISFFIYSRKDKKYGWSFGESRNKMSNGGVF